MHVQLLCCVYLCSFTLPYSERGNNFYHMSNTVQAACHCVSNTVCAACCAISGPLWLHPRSHTLPYPKQASSCMHPATPCSSGCTLLPTVKYCWAADC
jgi:hypothetical protein